MADSLTFTVSEYSQLEAGDSQFISFRPSRTGLVEVNSVPSPKTPKAEKGKLAKITFRPPGRTTPLEAPIPFPVGTSPILTSHNVTAEDLTAPPGYWTCEISNESDQTVSFATDVTYPIAGSIIPVSIDTEFLNLILQKLVSATAVQVHLESGDDGSSASSVTLSPDIAALLGLPTATYFPIADQQASEYGYSLLYRIKNLDSDPAYPIVVLLPDPLELRVVMRFDTTSARLIALLVPTSTFDINLSFFEIEIHLGFDGSSQVVCNANAYMPGLGLDVSDKVITAVQNGINTLLGEHPEFATHLYPKRLRDHIESFFIQLMRLGSQAHIQRYHVDGETLNVNHFLHTP